MSSNLQNSIWPNEDGTLGQIKVQIPTGTENDTIKWPTGDALVGNFVFNKGKLVGFVDTKALIANDSKTTTFPYEYVNISLPSIAEGEMTYNYDQCAYFILNDEVLKGDIPTDEELEIITKKYAGCKTLDDIKAVDPYYLTADIVDGVWSEGLGDLIHGGDGWPTGGMFSSCTALTAFSSDLSSLTHGGHMFENCTNLTSFNANLSSLTNCNYMFSSCSALTSFTSKLSSLTDGEWMFSGCSALSSFDSDLSSLKEGYYMFEDCKLDTASVQNIADTIKMYNGTIHISIGNSIPNSQEDAAFSKMVIKGWTVYVNGYQYTSGYYGTAASASFTTLDELGDSEMFNPIPYWAKPVNSDEEHARFVDSEGNFYNILGGNFIYGDNLETYGMFTSLEDAATQMRLKKIGEEEIETA